jgi:threonine dehydratase
MAQETPPTAAGIDAASRSIDPVFLDSPLIENIGANIALGQRLLVKVETLNPVRSFKGRGAEWWLANLPASTEPIVSASAGNFGQSLAYAAVKRGRRPIIFASIRANPAKLDAMRRFGAEVILEGQDFDAAKSAARSFADARSLLFVEDGGDRFIAEGAGTIAKEITEALDRTDTALDAVLVPLGNGALLTGVGAWIKAYRPRCSVVGIVAATAPAMKLSWETGRLESTPTAVTIADGIAIREPVEYALASMKGLVDEVLDVDEGAITKGMDFCRKHYGLIVEPAGAVGVGALLIDGALFAGRTVATILCGSNILEAD